MKEQGNKDGCNILCIKPPINPPQINDRQRILPPLSILFADNPESTTRRRPDIRIYYYFQLATNTTILLSFIMSISYINRVFNGYSAALFRFKPARVPFHISGPSAGWLCTKFSALRNHY